MSDITKIRLLSMLDNELRQVAGMISNEELWLLGSSDEEQRSLHEENLVNLGEYKYTLLRMRRQVVEETFSL